MVAEGCLHGRFQPFHLEHLECALAALERCTFLWIGLADPFPPEPAAHGPSPSPSAPLTYFERQFMITRTLVAEGIEPERFSVTPFPIESPGCLPHFLDSGITCVLAGNRSRVRQDTAALQDLGYPVEVLWERQEAQDSAVIRSLLIAEDDSWRDLVPASVSSYLDEIDLASRLREDPR